jgi:predicted ATPase
MKYAREATRLARDIDHAGSLVGALNMDAIVCQMVGDLDGVKRASAEFSALAERHGMRRFTAAAPIIDGWIAVRGGRGRSALAQMRDGIDTLENSDALMRISYFFGILADAQQRLGMIEAALDSVDCGLGIAARSGEGWYLPELQRLKGVLLLEASDDKKGVRQLEIALDHARKKSARWFELRTSTSLATHLATSGDLREARELLLTICSWFTEGAKTPELKNARALLEKLKNVMR